MAWPRGVSSVRVEVEAFARGDPDLPLHQVDAGDHLGDRMLHLDARVHLEEIERAVLVEQELDRPGVHVADRARDRRRRRGQRVRSSGETTGDGDSSITF